MEIELCSNALGLGKPDNFKLGSFQEVFNICHGGISNLALWEVQNNKITLGEVLSSWNII